MKYKINLLIFIAFLMSIFLLNGCKTEKYLSIIDGSKADGTITMAYEYGAFEKPIVHWEEALQSGIEKCKAWGYGGAEFFGSGTQNCISYGYNTSTGSNYCVRWRVTYKCQCTDK